MKMNFLDIKVLAIGLMILTCTCFINIHSRPMFNQQKIIVFSNGSEYLNDLADLFSKFEINYELVDAMDSENDQLHIIFDLFKIDSKKLPKYYIAYQSLDLQRFSLAEDYLEKLVNAVAIWDFSKDNICRYPTLLSHYYFLPRNYEFADPIFLPCFLPVQFLSAYKELLKRSNEINDEISSHLPTLFCYGILQNPNLVVEAGVDTGRSTHAFRKIIELCPAYLFGIDNNMTHAPKVYANLKNAALLNMDDCKFADYYMTTQYKNDKIDLIFIDTSHQYMHTLQEISQFTKLLALNGMLIFHDSNVTPENNGTEYVCLNGTRIYTPGNTRGVTQALKEYFEFEFDEYAYVNSIFKAKGSTWHLIHYPFCNGLTIMKLIYKE